MNELVCARAGRLRKARIAALVAVVPTCILLAAACGGSDFIDDAFGGPDATVDEEDARAADGSASVDGSPLPDGRVVDADLRDVRTDATVDAGSDADAATINDAGRDADAAIADAAAEAEAGIPDASPPIDANPPIDASPAIDASPPIDASLPDAAASNVPSLGGAARFAVLAGSTVTNSGALTTIIGDLGVSPGLAVSGMPPGQPVGTVFVGQDGPVTKGQLDLTTLYNELAGKPCPAANVLTGQDLAGKTLLPGVYCFSSSAALGVGTLTLDANGDPNAFWVFQIASTLDVAASTVNVIKGGTACNVFWQVGSSATLLDNARFAGNIVALASVTLNTGASVSPGRVLARNAAVTMLSNNVSKAACQ